MSPDIRALRSLYGLPDSLKARSVINTAIRRDWPGGTELLAVIERLHQMQHGRSRPDQALQDMLDKLVAARDKIAEAILSDGPHRSILILSPDASGETGQPYANTGKKSTPTSAAHAATDISSGALIADLGTQPDTVLGKKYGLSHTTVAKWRRKHGIAPFAAKPRVDWSAWDARILDMSMSAEGLAGLIKCDASTVRERRRYLRGDAAAKYRSAGAPLAEDRVDWSAVDWGKANATLSRELGVSRQTVAAQRKRHEP